MQSGIASLALILVMCWANPIHAQVKINTRKLGEKINKELKSVKEELSASAKDKKKQGKKENNRSKRGAAPLKFGDKSGIDLSREMNLPRCEPTMVLDINPGAALVNKVEPSVSRIFASTGDKLFFVGADEKNGVELWVTDGTAQGTRVVRDILPGRNFDSFSHGALVFGEQLVFLRFHREDNYNRYKLWRTNGTAAGTYVVNQSKLVQSATPGSLIPIGNTLFLIHKNELYKTTDIHQPFQLVKTFPERTQIDFFNAIAEENKVQLRLRTQGIYTLKDSFDKRIWVSDGSTEGTRYDGNYYFEAGDNISFARNRNYQLKKIYREGAKSYYLYGKNKMKVFFYPEMGSEILFAKSLNDTSEYWEGLGKFTEMGGFVTGNEFDLFLASQSSEYCQCSGLFRTDGKSTQLIKKLRDCEGNKCPELKPIKLFSTLLPGLTLFTIWTEETGFEIWRTDGTEEGTFMLRDINPGLKHGVLPQMALGPQAYLKGKLYFTALDGVHGMELWETDGTSEGTKMVKDIRLGPGSSGIHQLMASGNTLFFIADDGVHGRELWKYVP